MTISRIAFNQSLAQEYLKSSEQFPVNFDDAWVWLNYSNKGNAKRAFEKCGFLKDVDYCSLIISEKRETGATQKEVITLSVECFKTWAMMSQTEAGKQVRIYFLECEKIAKSYQPPQPVLPQTYIDALKALVKSEEEKELIRRENSLLEEQNHHLSEAVDELFSYSSIVRIAKFNNIHESNFKWQKLKATSLEMGIEIKRVPDARYEYKLLYSHDVWRVAYPGVQLPETTTLVIQG